MKKLLLLSITLLALTAACGASEKQVYYTTELENRIAELEEKIVKLEDRAISYDLERQQDIRALGIAVGKFRQRTSSVFTAVYSSLNKKLYAEQMMQHLYDYH